MPSETSTTLDFRPLLATLLVVVCQPLVIQADSGQENSKINVEVFAGFKCSDGISKSVCLPDDYNKFDFPEKDEAIQIGVDFSLNDIIKISDHDQSITVSVFLNLEWPETRLTLLPEFSKDSTGYKMIPVELALVKNLWLPNIFIYNMKEYKKMVLLSDVAGVWISTNKTVLFSQAVELTFLCSMRFGKFPFDTQVCDFRLGSYSYSNSKMTFRTKSAGKHSTLIGIKMFT